MQHTDLISTRLPYPTAGVILSNKRQEALCLVFIILHILGKFTTYYTVIATLGGDIKYTPCKSPLTYPGTKGQSLCSAESTQIT